MSTIIDSRTQNEVNALETAPLLGKIGQYLLLHVGADSWQAWQEQQIKIINEYRFDLTEKEDRQKLHAQMMQFFKLTDDNQEIETLSVGTPDH